MEDMNTTNKLIAAAYVEHRAAVYRYLLNRVGEEEDAKDLTQDVFLRLMSYGNMLRPDTVRSLIFTIASRLLVDHWRHLAVKEEMTAKLQCGYELYADNETDQRAHLHELQDIEQHALSLLPPHQRKVYVLTRFEQQSAKEISCKLDISVRTVENHLRIGRKQVREYIRRCV